MRNPASSGRSGHSRDGKRARKATTAAAQTMRPAPDRSPPTVPTLTLSQSAPNRP